MNTHIRFILIALVVASALLVGCAPQAIMETVEVQVTRQVEVEKTVVVEVIAAPTEAPAARGM